MAKKQRVKKVARHKKPQRAKAFYGGLGEGALKAGYEFAKQQGFEGTYNEWLQSLGANAGGNYTYIPSGGNATDTTTTNEVEEGGYSIKPGEPGFDPAKTTSTKRGEIGYDPAAGFVTQPEAPVIEKAEPIKYETIPGQPVSDKATWKKKEEEDKDEDPRDGARRGGIRRKKLNSGSAVTNFMQNAANAKKQQREEQEAQEQQQASQTGGPEQTFSNTLQTVSSLWSSEVRI